MRRVIYIIMAAIFILPGAGYAQEGFYDYWRMSSQAEEAGDLYHEGQYERARASYMRSTDMAGESGTESRKLHLNMGATFYKEGNYEAAEKEFNFAAGAEDEAVREEAYYNLGNVHFKKGMQSQELEDLEKAIENYTKALEINPENDDARFNIEVVRRHIDLQKKKQRPKCDKPGCDNKEHDHDQQKDQQKKQSGQQGQQQDQKNKDQQKDDEKQKEQGAQQKQQPQDGSTAKDEQNEQKRPSGSLQGKQMSEEEAKRLLQSIKKQEEENLEEYLQMRQGRPSREKDW